jgi:hypothetical protein
MIRDPSDGTVREGINPEANKINVVEPKTLSEEISGLPAGSQKQNNIARLEWSRDWLRKYHAKKEREHAGDRGADTATEAGLRDDRGGPD